MKTVLIVEIDHAVDYTSQPSDLEKAVRSLVDMLLYRRNIHSATVKQASAPVLQLLKVDPLGRPVE